MEAFVRKAILMCERLSAFELAFLRRVLDTTPRLVETIVRYPGVQAYWKELLERYRKHLLTHLGRASVARIADDPGGVPLPQCAPHSVGCLDLRRGHLADRAWEKPSAQPVTF